MRESLTPIPVLPLQLLTVLSSPFLNSEQWFSNLSVHQDPRIGVSGDGVAR